MKRDDSDLDQPATKRDLVDLEKRLEKRITNSIGGIITDALQLISNRFDQQDRAHAELKVEVAEAQAIAVRTENKLDATMTIVDDHSKQLRQLQAKLAG